MYELQSLCACAANDLETHVKVITGPYTHTLAWTEPCSATLSD